MSGSLLRRLAVVWCSAFVLAWLAQAAIAQISVSAVVSSDRARVGDTLSLTIAVRGAQSAPAPALTGIDGFDLRYAGASTQMTIVNGQVSSAVEHRYALVAQREGTFTLGPFSVDVQGTTYRTEPLQLVVGSAPPRPNDAPTNEPLRLVLTSDRQKIYLHERFEAEVALYVGNVSASDVQFPVLAADGLSIEEFGQPSRSAQMIDGQRFEVLRFRTTVTAVQAGSRTLGPATMGLKVGRTERNFFFAQRQPVELTSNALNLEVLPLPAEGRPAGFSGAVGQFTLEVQASPTEVQLGDPVTVRLALRGVGNLANAKAPAFADLAGFKAYDAQTIQSPPGYARVWEQVLIPESPQVAAVPATRFSYFDPAQGRYRTLEQPPIPLVVQAAAVQGNGAIVAGGLTTTRGKETLGSDIVYIKDDPGALVRRDTGALRWWLLLAWQPVPILLYVGALWFDRRRRRLAGDSRYARFTRAGAEAKAALQSAEASLRAGESRFFDLVEQAVRTYLSAKLGLPPGGVDPEPARAAGLPDEVTESLRRLLGICEEVRFAPRSAASNGDELLSLARAIVLECERNRSLRPRGA